MLRTIPIKKKVPPTLGLEKTPNKRFSHIPICMILPLRPIICICVCKKNIQIQIVAVIAESTVYDLEMVINSLLFLSAKFGVYKIITQSI